MEKWKVIKSGNMQFISIWKVCSVYCALGLWKKMTNFSRIEFLYLQRTSNSQPSPRKAMAKSSSPSKWENSVEMKCFYKMSLVEDEDEDASLI